MYVLSPAKRCYFAQPRFCHGKQLGLPMESSWLLFYASFERLFWIVSIGLDHGLIEFLFVRCLESGNHVYRI